MIGRICDRVYDIVIGRVCDRVIECGIQFVIKFDTACDIVCNML